MVLLRLAYLAPLLISMLLNSRVGGSHTSSSPSSNHNSSSVEIEEIEERLTAILSSGLSSQVYPGAVAIVGYRHHLFSSSVGRFTYSPSSPPVSPSTPFDLASLTKPLATTSALGALLQSGLVPSLDSLVADLLEDDAFRQGGKQGVTVRHLLTHTAGFRPDPMPWYWEEEFGCPATGEAGPGDPVELVSSCLPLVYDSLMREEVIAAPGTSYLYSDLSMITLQMVIGKRSAGLFPPTHQCFSSDASSPKSPLLSPIVLVCLYGAFLKSHVLPPSLHLPLPPSLRPLASPTQSSGAQYYPHQPSNLQGVVSDGDAYAMGGVAGHAGLFASAEALRGFVEDYVAATGREDEMEGNEEEREGTGYGGDVGLRASSSSSSSSRSRTSFPLTGSTVRLLTTVDDSSLSSRALGWDTNLQSVPPGGFGGVCGLSTADGGEGGFREAAFLHIGYTGTCICAEVGGPFAIILTNRVFNCVGPICDPVANSEDPVKSVFKSFNAIAGEELVEAWKRMDDNQMTN